MTSSEPPDGARARRSRRAVRHAGTVGGDDANLVSSHPALHATSSGGVEPDGNAPAGTAPVGSAPADVRRDHDGPAAPSVPATPGGGNEAASRPAPEPAVATRSADDSDIGWGDRETGSNDDRLHQDKPPHW